MASPTVSVILPTYNRASLLPRAVESVLSQTFSNWELFIVDDGSTDETPAVVRSYLADPRIHFLKKKHEGSAGKSRNAGMRLAKGKYVAFLDDDDLFLPEKLKRQVAWMDAHPAVGLLYSLIQVVDTEMNPLKVVPENPERSFLELFRENFIQVPTVLARRRCFDRVGFFDESLPGSEDYFLWLKIAEQFPIDHLGDLPVSLGAEMDAVGRERRARRRVELLAGRKEIHETNPARPRDVRHRA